MKTNEFENERRKSQSLLRSPVGSDNKVDEFGQNKTSELIVKRMKYLETLKEESHRRIGRHIIMCPPDFYKVEYPINDWTIKAMKLNNQVDVTKAKKQWEMIRDFYIQNDVTLTEVIPEPALHELTFFGDSIFLYNDHAVISNFKNKVRSPESDFAERWATENDFQIHKMPEGVFFEGNAMAIYWNGKILLGYGERTSIEAAHYLADWLKIEVIPIEIRLPFFHFDVACFPLDNKTMMVHPPALTTSSLALIKSMVQVIEVTDSEAQMLACNCMRIGQNVMFSAAIPNLQKKIEKLGYNVTVFPTDQFLYVGGGVKCLSLENYFLNN